MIDVQGLTKRYGSFLALNNISFKANAGEIIGFLGPNGAGKTTTMRILTGYMPPTAGTAKIAGFDIVTDSLEARRKIGYLPETVPLYPDMTVLGYVEFMADLRGVKNKRTQALRALEQVDLAHRAKSLVRSISKGMRQRLGLAQAIVHEPPVLILDEPTIGLDPQQVRDVRELVRSLGKNHTIIFSTHILTEAEQICDRVLIINQGEIIAQDTPAQLRDRLQSSGRVYLRARGQTQKLPDILKNLPNVEAVEPYQDGLIVLPRARKEIRPALAAAVANANLELLELRPLATSLEDIFIELTEPHA